MENQKEYTQQEAEQFIQQQQGQLFNEKIAAEIGALTMEKLTLAVKLQQAQQALITIQSEYEKEKEQRAKLQSVLDERATAGKSVE